VFKACYPGETYSTKGGEGIYEAVRHLREILAADIEGIGKGHDDETDNGMKASEALVNKWFQTSEETQNIVSVSGELKACLILKNPAF